MSRPRAWRRWKNYTKARRKRELDKELNAPFSDRIDGSLQQWLFYKNLHEYSKGKIHCSCSMCRNKTNNKGAAAYYNGSYNPTMMDWRKDISMTQQEFDFFENL